jgi:hypothetical protein
MRRRWSAHLGMAAAALVVAVSLIGAPSAGASPVAKANNLELPATAKVTVISTAVQVADKFLAYFPLKLRYEAAEGIISLAKGLLGAGSDPVGIPGTVVGGLDLDAYCQSIGDSYSFTPDYGNEAPGAAYTWSCVAASGAETPIVIQNACFSMYSSQVTIAYPTDVNNAYSWVCIAAATGTYTDPNATTYSLQASNGSVVLIVGSDGSVYLGVATSGGSDGTVVIDSDGSGYIASDGSGGTLPI